ncbi:PC4 domain-containing protein [Trichonephila clavipes]|nr:PC4 domain-containing protein [Trichonephila clavipes]
MKHATPLAFSHPRAKRVCFDKDNGKASSLKPDAVPENHFHLGSHNYAVVSDFADVARIHLHRYKLDATGSLLPTKDGITVTPSVWLALEREEAKHIPFPKSDCVDCIDAEMVLTTSMVELLCNHIEENISSLFGCLEGYENKLGHEFMTYSNGQRISEYGDLAILNMDWDKLVADFVNRNIQMVNYMNEMFLNKLNMNVLIENAKQMYVATDSLLLL